MVVERVKADMVPSNAPAAEKRFNAGVTSAAQLIRNIVDRRTHRIPQNHPDFKVKKNDE